MDRAANNLRDLEERLAAGATFTRADGERVLACTDLVGIGMLGELARRQRTGEVVTFLRVALVPGGTVPVDRGEAGEVRLTGAPASIEQAREWVRQAVAFAGGVPLTGFCVSDLLQACGGDQHALADAAARLRADGLEAVAEVALDRFQSSDEVVAVLRVLAGAGMGAWRATVDGRSAASRLDLIDRAASVQRAVGSFRAFAPLPRFDSPDAPSTGYDDVKTIATARLLCGEIEYLQVDWPLYGPKLAQVAVAFGANDIDGISPIDNVGLGPRRAPGEDIARQIRAASAIPVERNGRFVRSESP